MTRFTSSNNVLAIWLLLGSAASGSASATVPRKAAAAASTGQCPAQIGVATTFAAPPGWRQIAGDRTVRLRDVEIVIRGNGPDSVQAPDDDDSEAATDQDRRVTHWRILPAKGETAWLSCRYWDSTARLARPLPAGIRTCELERHRDGALWVPGKTICRS